MTLLCDDQPMVRVIVTACQQEVVQVRDCLLDALSLQELQSVDQLQQDKAHVLLELINPQAFTTLLEVPGVTSKLQNGRSAQDPDHGCKL